MFDGKAENTLASALTGPAELGFVDQDGPGKDSGAGAGPLSMS